MAVSELNSEALILGIETSCDETAAAVVRGGRELVSSAVASQDDLHGRFGGVVPEIASRRHSEVITLLVREALEQAQVDWDALTAIAVTHGPGLVGSLLVGVAAAKGYALATGLPLVGVNHLEAHLLANFVHEPGKTAPAQELFPSLCLIVSGGHTDLILVEALGQYRLVGWTRDDAAGEALDKAARVLGLGYPGGPAIDRAAKQGRTDTFTFPRPVVPDSFDFSFSGLKTALQRTVQGLGSAPAQLPVADLAASFQEAVVDTLVRNTVAAAREFGARQVLLAGGVAANSRLRQKMAEWERTSHIPVAFPPLRLCTDNAVMVAAAGYFKALRDGFAPLELEVFSSMPVAQRG
jgi:N6-L-threonylcarbamoyladenine synthase